LYAISDELHQLFVPGRSASLKDVLIDTLAALIGVICLIALSKFWAYLRKKPSPAG
jgi:VanZ family protein